MSENIEDYYSDYSPHSENIALTAEKLSSLHSSSEFMDFLDNYWGVQQSFVSSETFKLQGFYLSKAIKNINFNGKKLFSPWNSINGLTIIDTKRRGEDNDGEASWLLRMRFSVGEVGCAIQTDKNSAVLAPNLDAEPIKLSNIILPN
jgi:hypothetical protein